MPATGALPLHGHMGVVGPSNRECTKHWLCNECYLLWSLAARHGSSLRVPTVLQPQSLSAVLVKDPSVML